MDIHLNDHPFLDKLTAHSARELDPVLSYEARGSDNSIRRASCALARFSAAAALIQSCSQSLTQAGASSGANTKCPMWSPRSEKLSPKRAAPAAPVRRTLYGGLSFAALHQTELETDVAAHVRTQCINEACRELKFGACKREAANAASSAEPVERRETSVSQKVFSEGSLLLTRQKPSRPRPRLGRTAFEGHWRLLWRSRREVADRGVQHQNESLPLRATAFETMFHCAEAALDGETAVFTFLTASRSVLPAALYLARPCNIAHCFFRNIKRDMTSQTAGQQIVMVR
jgi:hypothetical protein